MNNAYQCAYFMYTFCLIGLIVYEIPNLATLPIFPQIYDILSYMKHHLNSLATFMNN